MIKYKFNEDKLIEEFKQYVDNTYSGHYGSNKDNLQSMEIISARGRGIDFTSGNIDKYNDRYGKKGSVNDWRKDILKIIHYGFLMLNEHDKRYSVADEDNSIKFVDDYIYTYPDTWYNNIMNCSIGEINETK